MKVIPVIDLKGGQVVRGVGGRRSEYRRVETILTDDASPAGIARAFATQFAVEEVYVADLDAIAGAEPNWTAYQAIGASGLRLWVDAGAGERQRAIQLTNFRGAEIAHIIVGLESLVSPAELEKIVESIGAKRVVFSLDQKEGRPITGVPQWLDAAPEEIAAAVFEAGVRHLIVLDLAHVGESRGPGAADVCRRLHERFPCLELIGGGGVRSVQDARELASAGCRGILLASALHDGRLTPEDVNEIVGL
jgi:phosphoribosylformimino-5-aminoimidazole carboxamide ribotide isomerase